MASLTVDLGTRSYPIFIAADLLSKGEVFLPYIRGNHVVIITNDIVAPLYLSSVLALLQQKRVDTIVVPDGEQYKNLQQFEAIMTQLLQQNAARDTTLIALGGGVIGDLCGFVAATFQRGVPFIQVPTTLLSQVDSSVGGKTAVNHPLGKNMIGAFYQPQSVIVDIKTLSTLPEREWSAGMAEVIKYGIITDAGFFHFLERHRDAIMARQHDVLIDMITRCCQIKADIVAADEREHNVRALLNLGHTFGHAIETELGFGTWLHGEAVAAGMVIACRVSEAMGWQTSADTKRVIKLLEYFNLPVAGPSHMNAQCYVRHMQHDKKVEAGKIKFIIPERIGHCVVTSAVDPDILTQILG